MTFTELQLWVERECPYCKCTLSPHEIYKNLAEYKCICELTPPDPEKPLEKRPFYHETTFGHIEWEFRVGIMGLKAYKAAAITKLRAWALTKSNT